MFYPTIAPELHLNDTPKPRFVAINHDLHLAFLSQNVFQSVELLAVITTYVLTSVKRSAEMSAVVKCFLPLGD